jgi:LEA14-like dessication related protein
MKQTLPSARGAAKGAVLIVALVMALSLSGCASFREAVEPVPPEVRVQSLRLTALDFTGVALEVDLQVVNPNPIGVTLAGYTYELLVEGNLLVSGEQLGGLEIPAKGESTVTIPMAFTFQELRESVAAVATQREVAYSVRSDVTVDIPILGYRTIPVQREGKVPIPRFPRPDVRGISVRSVGFSGAEMVATLDIENPNVFSIVLDEIQYRLVVNGTEWLSGRPPEAIEIAGEATTTISVPFTLRILDIGRSAFRVITEGGPVSYTLEYDSVLHTDHPLVPVTEVPLRQSGEVRLLR